MSELAEATQNFLEHPATGAEPWAQPAAVAVDGAKVLAEVERFITRYVVLPNAARLPVSLWAIATHAAATFDVFPYLVFSSGVPRCGKSRAIEILELLCARAWRGTTPSEAGLFRFLADCPTLLLDEIESLRATHRSERDQAILSILNVGYRRGATVLRWSVACRSAEKVPVFGPKSFCCVGDLPLSLSDRSIVIRMQRRSPSEPVARFRFSRATTEVSPTKAAVELIVRERLGEITETYAALPDLGFLSDRDCELFSPLFAVLAVLAPARVAELERSARFLSGEKSKDAADGSLPLKLIDGIFKLWPENLDAWLTAGVLAALREEDESPWRTEIELTPRRLALMLRPFEIFPRQVRTPFGTGKGYLRSELLTAHARYITPENETSETTRMNVGDDAVLESET